MPAGEIAKTTNSDSEEGAAVVAKASDPDGSIDIPEPREVQVDIDSQPKPAPGTDQIDREAVPKQTPMEETATPDKAVLDDDIAYLRKENWDEPSKGVESRYESSWMSSRIRGILAGEEARPGAKRDRTPRDRETNSGGEDATVTLAPNYVISDEHFIRNLERLKELISFLIQEAVPISASEAGALVLGRLNLLKGIRFPDATKGRDPTEEEWNQVERRTQVLFSVLTPPLRRRFVLGAVPKMLAWLPMLLAVIALVALITAVIAYRVDLL
jgi:hypothetical protein